MLKRLHRFFMKNHTDEPENILDDHTNELGSLLSKFINFLVFAFIVVFCFETIGNNSLVFAKELFIFDFFISTVFGLEYLYRLYKTNCKLHFAFSPIGIVDLLSFLPFFLGLFAVGNFLIILRLFRILRVLRIARGIPLTTGFLKALKDYADEYKAVFLLFLIILFLGSSYVYFLEYQVEGTKFTSVPMSLWWGLVTMTTVGFGDMYPLTNAGKMVGSVLVLFGPLMLALISAVTIAVFHETSKNEALKHGDDTHGKVCPRCKELNPKEANYCMNCGKGL